MGVSQRIESIYDLPMWRSVDERRLALQKCDDCGAFRYPPGPACPDCLSLQSTWTPVSGKGEILSWVVFHRKYFDDHPPPYNAVAVKLEEGPIVVSRLVGEEPKGDWIGRAVQLDYQPHNGRLQHVVRLATEQD